jgi:signal transduction histidine kinase
VRLSLRAQLGLGIVLVTGVIVLLVLASSKRQLVEEFARLEGGRDSSSVVDAAAKLAAWSPDAAGFAWRGADSVLATVHRPRGVELVLQSASGAVVAATRADLRHAHLSGGAEALVLTYGDEGRMMRLMFDHPPVRELLGSDGRVTGTLYSFYMPGRRPAAGSDPVRGAVNRVLLWPVVGGALVSVLLLFVATSRAIAPLGALTQATRRLAAGDLTSRVSVSGATELAELSTAFNGMAGALERAEGLRRQMVSDVAHELRTPLTNLRCRIVAIQDGLAPADPAALRALHDETLLLARLVEDLQLLSLAEAGRLPLERAAYDLRELAAQAVAAVQPRAEAAGVVLALADGPPLTASVDAARIGQVLRNLLANAITHTPSGGEVRVSADMRDGMAWLEVRDSGVGLTPEQQEHVFDRFWRADASRTRDGDSAGSGLGLAIVRQLVALHGGDVSVASAPGAGATFRVRLPAAGFTPSSSRAPTLSGDGSSPV